MLILGTAMFLLGFLFCLLRVLFWEPRICPCLCPKAKAPDPRRGPRNSAFFTVASSAMTTATAVSIRYGKQSINEQNDPFIQNYRVTIACNAGVPLWPNFRVLIRLKFIRKCSLHRNRRLMPCCLLKSCWRGWRAKWKANRFTQRQKRRRPLSRTRMRIDRVIKVDDRSSKSRQSRRHLQQATTSPAHLRHIRRTVCCKSRMIYDCATSFTNHTEIGASWHLSFVIHYHYSGTQYARTGSSIMIVMMANVNSNKFK